VKLSAELKQLLGWNAERTDVERLFLLARRRGCSEYDIFRLAAGEWNVPDFFVERDFGIYLKQVELPHYVRNYVRREFDADSDDEEMNELVRLFLRWLERRKKSRPEAPP